MRSRLTGLLLALVVGMTAGAGCAADPDDDPRVDVVVSFYPLQFLAERIGGPEVAVESLTPPGSGSHNPELSPRQVGRVGTADLVVYQSGFQAATDAAVRSQQPRRTVDAAQVAEIRDHDPHVWLDLDRYRAIAGLLTDGLSEADPVHAELYRARLATLSAELGSLDQEFRTSLAPCWGATLVTAHTAFGYLAERYGLRQVGIAGIDPEIEPSPARVREVSRIVEQHDVRTLYFETSTSPQVTRALADDLGVRTTVLDPIEGRTGDGDFLTAMRANLTGLRTGLTCG